MSLQQSAPAAVVFVTDEGYSLPTIVAAKYARRHVAPELADVIIVSHSLHAQGDALVAHAAKGDGVQHLRLEGRPWENIDLSRYNRTHVPPSALARFFLPDRITRAYERILYLDGDVIPMNSLHPLVELPLDSGAFAAAEDRAFFYAQELGPTGKRTRAYFKRLGVRGRCGYFNSGVLLAMARTWTDISKDAFRFFQLNSSACLYHDQSALNAVASDRRVRLSPRWNFQTDYFGWDPPETLAPEIIHFAGGEKPWKSRLDGLEQFSAIYSEELAQLNADYTEESGFPPLLGLPASRSAESQGRRTSLLTRLRRSRRRAELSHLDVIAEV